MLSFSFYLIAHHEIKPSQLILLSLNYNIKIYVFLFSGRNEEEDVNLSVLEFQNDRKVILTASSFHFYTDGTFYLAQFLVESVFNTEALDDFELIKSDDFNLADEELSTLDKRLSCALASCDFPEWWSLLGSDSTTGRLGCFKIYVITILL